MDALTSGAAVASGIRIDPELAGTYGRIMSRGAFAIEPVEVGWSGAEFHALPFRLYRDGLLWVAPLHSRETIA